MENSSISRLVFHRCINTTRNQSRLFSFHLVSACPWSDCAWFNCNLLCISPLNRHFSCFISPRDTHESEQQMLTSAFVSTLRSWLDLQAQMNIATSRTKSSSFSSVPVSCISRISFDSSFLKCQWWCGSRVLFCSQLQASISMFVLEHSLFTSQ